MNELATILPKPTYESYVRGFDLEVNVAVLLGASRNPDISYDEFYVVELKKDELHPCYGGLLYNAIVVPFMPYRDVVAHRIDDGVLYIPTWVGLTITRFEIVELIDAAQFGVNLVAYAEEIEHEPYFKIVIANSTARS